MTFLFFVTPKFGSCWGLQVAAAAAGIPVEENPNGREQGLGLGGPISLSTAGSAHPLFKGSKPAFAALMAHTDQVGLSGWAGGSCGAVWVIGQVRGWTWARQTAFCGLWGMFVL